MDTPDRIEADLRNHAWIIAKLDAQEKRIAQLERELRAHVSSYHNTNHPGGMDSYV